jgi:hypothetical protein
MGRETSRLVPAPMPMPNLFKKLMDQSAAVPEFMEMALDDFPPE